MLDADADAFDAVIQDLCLAFNRPHTVELTRVYWESMKHLRIDEVRRAAMSARNNLRKFPTPKDLTPEKRYAPPPEPTAVERWSRWAIAANRILMAVAYFDERRGFLPIGADLMPRLLEVKADYVRMAEEAERDGATWDHVEFNRMCREGFQKILGTAVRMDSHERHVPVGDQPSPSLEVA